VDLYSLSLVHQMEQKARRAESAAPGRTGTRRARRWLLLRRRPAVAPQPGPAVPAVAPARPVPTTRPVPVEPTPLRRTSIRTTTGDAAA
jgi:hypothetical protein